MTRPFGRTSWSFRTVYCLNRGEISSSPSRNFINKEPTHVCGSIGFLKQMKRVMQDLTELSKKLRSSSIRMQMLVGVQWSRSAEQVIRYIGLVLFFGLSLPGLGGDPLIGERLIRPGDWDVCGCAGAGEDCGVVTMRWAGVGVEGTNCDCGAPKLDKEGMNSMSVKI